jgi:hypothetical protein
LVDGESCNGSGVREARGKENAGIKDWVEVEDDG